MTQPDGTQDGVVQRGPGVARGAQSAPPAWVEQYGQGEGLVLLVGLWKAIAAGADPKSPIVTEMLRALGPPPS